MLYVKPNLTLRQLVAELVVAQVAIAAGLPCPKPYIVSVAPHTVGRPRGPAIMAFGCEQVGPRGMATPVRDRSLMLEMLRKVKAADGAAVLDEFVVNDVRGPGDVVFDPYGSVWLIDHEAALAKGVPPDEAVTNWLGDRLREETEPHRRDSLLGAFRAAAVKVQKLQFEGCPAELSAVNGATGCYDEVLQFLQNRLLHLDRLLSLRVIPDQRYLTDTESINAQNDETHRHPHL